MIRRYPVVFPDNEGGEQKTQSIDIMSMGIESFGGLEQPMPHEFHDLVRDLLSKDPSERLGSEEFMDEFVNHSFFKTY